MIEIEIIAQRWTVVMISDQLGSHSTDYNVKQLFGVFPVQKTSRVIFK
jgi:hypothetical protein